MKKFGLIGKNLTYSHSKYIHEFFIEQYKVAATYDLIQQEEFDSSTLDQYDGLNITIPYKQDVIKYLDVNNASIAAINTIMNKEGILSGYNTDILGFALLVDKLKLDDIKKVVILGGGATSLMVKEYFKSQEVVVISRKDKTYNYEYLTNIQADLLVNTTPVGMNEFKSPIKEELLVNYRGVIDLNYNPFNSKLSLDCKKYDIKFINGLYMLIKQAAKSFEIWNDLKISDDIIEKLYLKLLFKTNKKVALIGMPLSGKTTLTKRYRGYDLDKEIEKEYNEKIPMMLENNTFRDRESFVLKKMVNQQVPLLALGGGCILKHSNIELLKDYLLVYLKVDLTILKGRLAKSYRPLLKSEKDLEDTFKKRKPLYEKYANVIVDRRELEELLNENRNN